MPESSHITACARFLRTEDYDRYLTVLHARAADRPGLFALYAFNAEIAKIRDIVSEPMVGEIRLQWWRDVIGALDEGRVREHDVVRGLDEVTGQGALTQAELIALIDARDRDLYGEQPESLDDLEDYLGATAGGIQRLAAKMLSGGAAAQVAAHGVGLAWGLCGIMRALPYHLAQNRIYIPSDMMRAAGLADPSRRDEEQTAALVDILRMLTGRARGHIAAARERAGTVEPGARAAMRLAPLAEGYLNTLEKAGFDPEAADYARGALGRQARLAWAALRRRY